MKVAVTYQNGSIFQHFGHTEEFKLYNVEGDRIVSTEIISSEGSGHGALAEILAAHGVDTLICGGIGAGAQNALAQAGIRLYGGVSGDADGAVESLIFGMLSYDPNVSCNHHGPGHVCDSHGCGGHGHSCGGH